MTRYRITHETHYSYSKPVSLCHNEAHLLPRTLPSQRVQRAEVRIHPEPAAYHERKDFFGNAVTYFSVQEAHKTLVVTATSEVEVDVPLLPELSSSPSWKQVRKRLRSDLGPETLDARQFVLDSPFVSAGEALANYAKPSFAPGRPVLNSVHELMSRIHADFTYDPKFTTLATPLSEVLEHRRGVCQDFAHLAIGCLRSLGLAARYVSGYLETTPPPGRARLVGADASHAWFAVYVPGPGSEGGPEGGPEAGPGGGWVDFDPTNDRIPMDKHITTAWGRDYTDISPLKGIIFGGGRHTLKVAVDVRRL